MRHHLPLIAAILAGVSVLVASLSAVLYRVPAYIGESPAPELVLRGVAAAPDSVGLTAGFITALIVFLSLAGLAILFFIEVLNPKAQRRRHGGARGVNELLDALQVIESRRRY
jgi:hypothetical protein